MTKRRGDEGLEEDARDAGRMDRRTGFIGMVCHRRNVWMCRVCPCRCVVMGWDVRCVRVVHRKNPKSNLDRRAETDRQIGKDPIRTPHDHHTHSTV